MIIFQGFQGFNVMNCDVNSPKHYTDTSIQPIDVIEEWELGFHLGNTVKYIARHKKKGSELKDLKKAQFYLNRYIDNFVRKGNNN